VLSGFDPDASLWVAGAAGAVLCGCFLLARLRYLAIPPLSSATPADAPDCMVVIPARNEESFIAEAVSSLPNDTVIVVDDHSSDHTAEAARKAGAGVIPAGEPGPGVSGKANACMAGARLLDSKWILFADADTRFAPGFLNAAVASAEASGLSFLSIYLRAEFTGLGDRVLGPYAQALYFVGITPRGDPAAIFNGQCLLVQREPYQFLGGHAAVLNSLVDDVKLAALARRHRLKFSTARTESLGRVRFRDLKATFLRSGFRFLLTGWWSGIAILLAALLAAMWLPVLAWLLAENHGIAAAIFGLLPTVLLLPWYRNVWSAIVAPLAIYRILPILFRAAGAALLGRRVEWKDRLI